ncbi:MAG: hypothetical protein ACD_15C00202G0014 [uncultured bacterium]|nr:MAG: hypothetical protein ACD_15C00202G0014 [uncultured bacterium]HCU70872.1 hypothetical protein [Candidatus Moranbacteria bacterium]
MSNSVENSIASNELKKEKIKEPQETENNSIAPKENGKSAVFKDKELHREDPQDIYRKLSAELIEKYGRDKVINLATKEDGNIFPCEISREVREIITDPRDWAIYYRLAQAWHEMEKGEKYVKPEGHPHTLFQLEKDSKKPEIIIADQSAREKYKENWPYKSFSFEEWEANGFLITKEGLPSKLERKFYELVRSDEFKEWFGDWENGDGEANNMVDGDTGEPQAFYRGDKSRFKPGFIVLDDYDRTLDERKLVNEQGEDISPFTNEGMKALSRRQGVFFTDNKEVAVSYGVDINADTLGKAGLESEKDHPETFSKLKNWLESFADNHPSFWKDITRNILDYSPEVEKDEYKYRFHDMCREARIFGKGEDDLWDEITAQRRHEKPSHYMDLFVKSGNFERLMEGFNLYVLGEHSAFLKRNPGNNNWHKPEWMLQFRKLRLDYLTEPLALSTVFIRSKNPKIETRIDVTERADVHWARRDGHDSFINKEGVGGIKWADEIVVYDLKNIWVADKRELIDEAKKDFFQSRIL